MMAATALGAIAIGMFTNMQKEKVGILVSYNTT